MLENQLKKKDFGGSSSTGSSIINGIEVFQNENKLTKKNSITLNKNLIHSIINPPVVSEKLIHEIPKIGIINGLYATKSFK